MPNSVKVTSFFEIRYKRFIKKFSTLEAEIDELTKQLLENPTQGISLGAGLYKIRLASKSKSGGKSGGFRVITYLITKNQQNTEINLITMFDKSEEDNINKNALMKIVKKIFV